MCWACWRATKERHPGLPPGDNHERWLRPPTLDRTCMPNDQHNDNTGEVDWPSMLVKALFGGNSYIMLVEDGIFRASQYDKQGITGNLNII